jgi:hypothetical protein
MTKNSIAGICPDSSVVARAGGVEPVLGHEPLDDLRREAARPAAEVEPFELLRLGDVGAGAQAEDGIGRLLVVDRHHLELRSIGARDHHARHVDEADIGGAGLDRLDHLRGALRRNDRDVEAFRREITLGQRRIPRRMAAERNEVEREHDLGRRLRGGRGRRPGNEGNSA